MKEFFSNKLLTLATEKEINSIFALIALGYISGEILEIIESDSVYSVCETVEMEIDNILLACERRALNIVGLCCGKRA